MRTIKELSKDQSLTIEVLKEEFRSHARGGFAVSAQEVFEVVARLHPSRADVLDLALNARWGLRLQYSLHNDAAAKEYERLADRLNKYRKS